MHPKQKGGQPPRMARACRERAREEEAAPEEEAAHELAQNLPTLEMWNAPTEDQVHAMRQAGVAAAMGMRGSENDTDEQFLAHCRERRMDSHTGTSDDEFSDDPEDENELRHYQAI